jgi:SAM-dependent methyltransferase
MSQDGFDPSLFGALSEAERAHFWFRSRTRLIQTMAVQATEEYAPGYRILEVGCGTGHVLRALEDCCAGADVTGIDQFQEALDIAARGVRRARLIRGDLFSIKADERFDLIGMFDVLEHIPDDEAAVRRAYELLRPGGRYLLTVPAHASLWSYFDEASHHQRRYSRGDLRTRLCDAGFQVEYLSEFFSLLLPMAWLARVVRANDPESRDKARRVERDLRPMPILNEVAYWVFRAETAFLSRRVSIPFGTSIVAVARRLAS